jgi:hypothetical protein
MVAIDEELCSSRITTIPPLGTFYDNPTGHGSAPDQIPATTDKATFGAGTLEFSLSKNSTLEISNLSSTEGGTTGIHVVQITSPQIGIVETTPIQVSGGQISVTNNSPNQGTFSQENPPQIGSSQIGSLQIDFMEVSPSQVDISQNHTVEVKFSTIFGATKSVQSIISQFDPSKVTFPISIPLQQFVTSNFPDHYLPPASTNTYKDNPLNLWSTLFDPTFKIDLQIADLPTGQLAETQITKYDSLGRPNGGTLLIDADVNGIG